MISYTPGGNVYPFVDPVIYFRSNLSKISSYVDWNLYTRSSGSLNLECINSSSIWFLKVP